MHRQTGLWITVAALVVLLGAAGFVYQNLSARYQPQGVNIVKKETAEQKETEKNTASESESAGADIAQESESAGVGAPQESEAAGDGGAQESEAAGDGGAQESSASQEAAQELVQAYDFTVQNAAGETISLSELTGSNPVVLNFWASWCGPCKKEMPHFQAAYEELAGEVEFVMVNLTDGSRETVDTARKFLEQEGYTFPAYFDVGQSAAYAYAVNSIPTTYFIDEEGYLTAYAQGTLTEEQLWQGIGMIYQEQ